MRNRIIRKSVTIKTPPALVWYILSDPIASRKVLGGIFVTDWEVGGPFGWKGEDSEAMIHGRLLQLETNKLIKHSVFLDQDESITAKVVTFRLEQKGDTTVFSFVDYLSPRFTRNSYREEARNWQAALNVVKMVAELSWCPSDLNHSNARKKIQTGIWLPPTSRQTINR